MSSALPWRGPGPDRPDLPLPPGKVPLRHNGVWRKRWRYLAAFSDELLLCAARIGVGPVSQTVWAVWEDNRSGQQRIWARSSAQESRSREVSEASEGMASFPVVAANGALVAVVYEGKRDGENKVLFRALKAD